MLLGAACDRCGTPGRPFSVSAPGDIRPALGRSEALIKEILEKHFMAADRLRSRLIYLNKVSGEDRSDEVVVGGRVIGTLRFDLKRNEHLFDLKLEGANLIGPEAKRGVVVVRHQQGHLKGKNLTNEDILEVRGRFEPEDPLIVIVGSSICSAVARASSSQRDPFVKSIHIREVGKLGGAVEIPKANWTDFVESNLEHLKALESKAVSDVKSFTGNRKLPVTLSFSGGKDSLACYGIVKKAVKQITLLFINTGLEFPETIDYVHNFARKNKDKLLVAEAGNAFWEQVDSFGPPAKDFRWCCKVCKLAPLTELIERNFSEGTVTIEGNRALESFARADTGFVENNPFVPNQTVLNPIRGWRAAEVWAYIWWKGLDYNPLYEEDFERIGCYLCPACLASEWKSTEAIHPDLHRRWSEHLVRWSKASGTNQDYVRYGFWRWKVLPPKMLRLAEEIKLNVPRQRSDRMKLSVVKGVSPCVSGGYSVEGVISVPSGHPFSRVGETLKCLGATRYAEEYQIAITKAGDATVKAFGGGQLVATAPTPEMASGIFEAGVKSFLRAQLCTMCGICVKNCKRRAITLDDGPVVDEGRCDQCGSCLEACVVAHYYDKLISAEKPQA
jgi:phosphoadenosine phosphosulfate reductase